MPTAMRLWNDAACVGPKAIVFSAGAVEAAKAVCRGCPGRVACLAWAPDEPGVWGGHTQAERRRMRTRVRP